MDINLTALAALFSFNFALLIDTALKILALIVIPNNRKPSAATAWLLAIFFIPLVGWPLFIILGKSDLARPRKKRQDQVTNNFKLVYKNRAKTLSLSKSFNSIASLNHNLSKLPLVKATKFKLISDYDEFFNSLIKDIKKAKNSIWFEFYIVSYDQTTAELLGELAVASKRGVKVRILFDHLGSWMYPGYKDFITFCTQNNIEFYKMQPIKLFNSRYFERPDLRNHRKLMVIDGKVGYMGSQNIIDSSYNKRKNIKRNLKWRELNVRLEGEVVSQLQAVFANDWYAETEEKLLNEINFKPTKTNVKSSFPAQILPSGPGYQTDNNLRLFNSVIYAAKQKIVITSPYFVPDESMYMAITTAARRGVEVILFVSAIKDQFLVYHAQRSYYERLMVAGVRIYMYKAPYVLHSKHVSVDDSMVVIGSSNMDIRSFELNQEISLLAYNKKLVQQMTKVETKYMNNSKQLKLKEWQSRPYYEKVVDNLARLTSGLQ
ncbi:cardiolipin synthase [Candidatus Saccharibacteria bacterium]|nr:cardiolipin synthase [Candidatus Saccharibacteria bacterium]